MVSGQNEHLCVAQVAQIQVRLLLNSMLNTVMGMVIGLLLNSMLNTVMGIMIGF